MNLATLPSGFERLEPFSSLWAIDGTANRAAARSASSFEQREAFFAAASPFLDRALEHLDARELGKFSDADQRLLNLMLSLAHVALAVEIQGPQEAKTAPWRDRMKIHRSPADERNAP